MTDQPDRNRSATILKERQQRIDSFRKYIRCRQPGRSILHGRYKRVKPDFEESLLARLKDGISQQLERQFNPSSFYGCEIEEGSIIRIADTPTSHIVADSPERF